MTNPLFFEVAKVLYEARIREAYGFSKEYAEQRLQQFPFPRHPADGDVTRQTAEADLAIAQAKALLKSCDVTLKS